MRWREDWYRQRHAEIPAAFRPEVGDRVPSVSRGTIGRLDQRDGGDGLPLDSGSTTGLADALERRLGRLPDAFMSLKSTHVAAWLWLHRDVKEATLYINKRPCPDWRERLDSMLHPWARQTVFAPGGFRRLYHGRDTERRQLRMLVIHRGWQQQLTGHAGAIVPVAGVSALDALLDELHAQAVADGYPHAVTIYPGDRYPHGGYGEGDRWIDEDPGDGLMPELTLVVGAEQSPVYWDEPSGKELISIGAGQASEPAGEDPFEFFYGGQESFAPRSSLVLRDRVREAARLFAAIGGQQPATFAWQAG